MLAKKSHPLALLGKTCARSPRALGSVQRVPAFFPGLCVTLSRCAGSTSDEAILATGSTANQISSYLISLPGTTAGMGGERDHDGLCMISPAGSRGHAL